ncbi:MAG: enoyl-CoA hydratase/isomerase family protein [Bacteroidota bacterium]
MAIEFNTVKWEDCDGIGLLQLCRPPSNAMNRLFFTELSELTAHIKNSGVKAIVITGSGRHFSSGADIANLLDATLEDVITRTQPGNGLPDFLVQNNRSFSFFEQLKIPVIAAIKGVCLGSALELALFAHFRFCGEGALLGLPEATFNLMPGCGASQTLPPLCGKAKAMELILTGANFSPADAVAWGIADRIFPKKELVSASLKFAAEIAEGYEKKLKPRYLKKYFPDGAS